MALNTTVGWISGDDVRVLIASGLGVSGYGVSQIQVDMNYLGEMVPDAVGYVQDLLDQYDVAQSGLSGLNNSSEGKVLTKADVLEWVPVNAANAYSFEKEIMRIQGLLRQYFSFSVLFGGVNGGVMGSSLVRS